MESNNFLSSHHFQSAFPSSKFNQLSPGGKVIWCSIQSQGWNLDSFNSVSLSGHCRNIETLVLTDINQNNDPNNVRFFQIYILHILQISIHVCLSSWNGTRKYHSSTVLIMLSSNIHHQTYSIFTEYIWKLCNINGNMVINF